MLFGLLSLFLVIAGAYSVSKWFTEQVKYIKSEITENEPLIGMLT